MKWKDTTSYSREDKERIPVIWLCSAGDISVCVHRHIYYPPDQWLLTCRPFFDKYELPDKNIDDVKKTALGMVAVKLRRAALKIKDFATQDNGV